MVCGNSAKEKTQAQDSSVFVGDGEGIALYASE
jgi:hypothetical protein